MAISVVQSNVGNMNNSAGPLAVAFSSNNTSGNLLVASFWAIQFSGISDSQGNTWTRLFLSSYTVSTANQYIYYCLSCKPGANTVTATFTAAGSYCGLQILEASGGTWTVDGTATGNSGSGTSLSSGAMTTTGTNDLLVSSTYNSSGVVITAGSGWTTQVTGTSNDTLQTQIVTSSGSQTSTATAASSTNFMIDIGAFTASSSNVSPTVTGSILVTGSPIATIVYAETISGTALVTGSVTPTITSTVSPTVTGNILVTGSVSPFTSPIPVTVTGNIFVTGSVNPTIIGGSSVVGSSNSNPVIQYWPYL